MSKRSPKSVSEKQEIVQLYQNHEKSLGQLRSEYGVSDSTLRRWVYQYKIYGLEGLQESHTWTRYTKELKEQAVQDYLDGRGSQLAICQRYGISSVSVLIKWIKRYTSGREIKATSKGFSRMKQGRQTTFEERIEIVQYTMAHNKHYQAAVEKFGVSYQQVYSWVRKFEKDGPDGLIDRRGKDLESKAHLSPEEELQLKIKQLEERNRYLEMEIAVQKKLQELNRRSLK